MKPLSASLDERCTGAPPSDGHLKRTLENRHIQLISIGGAIGTGLFMGSGKVIALSGTSILLVYAILGFFLFFVMRAMGELLLCDLRFKSFADIVAHYLGPRAGFVLSWSYWLSWSVAVVGDVVVVAGFFQYWFPDVPAWMPAFLTLFVLLGLNMLAVRIFGEVEFWFGIIKIVAIVLLILTATVMIATSYTSPNGVVASLSNVVAPGVIFPHGISGFFAGFQIAVFSFAGTELIGTTAAEAKNPQRTLPKAINTIPLRILLFYILALVCIISVVSWSQVPADRSPFVELFLLAGFPAAAGMINFVVLTSAASSANSGVYSGCRMLFGLAERRHAPAILARLSVLSVPVHSLLFSAACMLTGLTLLFIIPEVMTVFTLISTVSAILVIFTWSMILAAYIAYRKRNPAAHSTSTFKSPGGVPMALVTLTFLAFVLVLLALEPDTRMALCAMPAWFIFLLLVYGRRNAAANPS
ncbi:amino acid permease [Pseudomonas sp. S75]|uniref:amino acid permease n=1 Tax=unclassified Pseudomonas TaxID=196821 RepID=UPI00190689CE|nr:MULTISPECIES: amino acid permease [unclassified Pseudomonas]MBJ9975166.1 amino acid permease [Pseudomonas sp. S30]MBK0153003.1 amino acid permease [Pseudomonas sp. S75]